MIVYWSFFAILTLGSFVTGERSNPSGKAPLPLLFLAMVFIALMIGLRYEVGADWENYEFIFSYARFSELGEMLVLGDPGYQFINWVVQAAGFEIWVVNMFCGVVFAAGLFSFARIQPNPWLAVLIAFPYFAIVVAMGYSRQSVALAVVMAGLAALCRGRSITVYIGYIALAATFHKSAVLALPVAIFAGQRNLALNLIVGLAASVLLYDVFVSDAVEGLMRNYVEAEYSSQGAIIRVAMGALPALIYLPWMHRFAFDEGERKLWRNFALAALALVIVLATTPSSTAVDRVALYVLPLQIAIFCRLGIAFPGFSLHKVAVAVYCFAIQFVWLNFAEHAQYWVPYQLYPLW
ncbi:EpsG family protein [Sphingomonas sp. LY29]|uniref:EpsG family protein n=1 Tax=Sphingomonas sp. LY29 TaxID=3095341 RepID=UPI002D76672C|nr:EpsG family protein [Sphingomonas sp. LY29]WRP26237.1 EpsG family protein [Sphingomonas sp. LY29]